MNIVEWTDVGVPLKTAYNAFTEFENWPDFMKKVENVERLDDVKLKFKGQVFLSHRTWEATITEQVADSHIVWESTGEKGHISGSVSFHEVTPTLTRMLTIGEYHPQGFMERTGNLWRAVGRRFRLELKFFVHHVMTEVILDPESVEGWRGEIRDGEVVTSHEDALEQESEEEEAQQQEESDPEAESEPDAEGEEDSDAEDDYAEEEEPAENAPTEEDYEEEEPEEEAPAEDEYAEEEEPEEEAPAEDEYAEEEEPAEEAPAEEEPAEDEAEYDEETQDADEEPEPR
nr:SRPBCC family protein [Nesterenkonia sp. Act20]